MVKSKPQTQENFSERNFTRVRLPRFPWQKAKELVLGANYDLSLVFIGQAKSRALNLKHRGKNKPANVLSFPLSKTSGEIFLNPHSPENLFYLFIHGLLHLAGFDHGSKMEHKENSLGRFFGFNFDEERNRRGPRYRDRLHPGHRKRKRGN